jgi:ElaB/YqjD/DUF883 family membrane-anchored ribosome-binding protein
METTMNRTPNPENDTGSIEKLKDGIDDASQTVTDTARAAIDKGREVLSKGRDAVSDFSDDAQRYVSRNLEGACSSTATFVRDRPLSAMALAAGAGILATLLLTRVRR